MTDFDSYTNSFKDFSGLIFSGGTFYGGLVFGALFAVWYIKKHKMNFMILGDMVGPGVALAHFFGRLGCFSAGCCWGREAHDSAIAVTFTDTRATTGVLLDTPLYPTQLMEAILNLLNFIILIFLYHRKKFHGQIFAIYIFNYSIIRFCLEFFRGDGDRGYVIGSMEQPFSSLSVPQLISLIGIITAIILYRIFKKKSQTDEQKLKK